MLTGSGSCATSTGTRAEDDDLRIDDAEEDGRNAISPKEEAPKIPSTQRMHGTVADWTHPIPCLEQNSFPALPLAEQASCGQARASRTEDAELTDDERLLETDELMRLLLEELRDDERLEDAGMDDTCDEACATQREHGNCAMDSQAIPLF